MPGLENIQYTLHGAFGGLFLDFLHLLTFDHTQRGLHQIAHHRVDITPDIADLGEFGCQASGDLRFADTCGADHQNVLGNHFIAQVIGQTPPPGTITQGNRNGSLSRMLADDVLIQFRDDLAWGQIFHRAIIPVPNRLWDWLVSSWNFACPNLVQ
jgi:hypothetical protein